MFVSCDLFCERIGIRDQCFDQERKAGADWMMSSLGLIRRRDRREREREKVKCDAGEIYCVSDLSFSLSFLDSAVEIPMMRNGLGARSTIFPCHLLVCLFDLCAALLVILE